MVDFGDAWSFPRVLCAFLFPASDVRGPGCLFGGESPLLESFDLPPLIAPLPSVHLSQSIGTATNRNRASIANVSYTDLLTYCHAVRS